MPLLCVQKTALTAEIWLETGLVHDATVWSNLRHGGAVGVPVSRGHGQSDQLSHGHFQQTATGRLGLRGEQSLRR